MRYQEVNEGGARTFSIWKAGAQTPAILPGGRAGKPENLLTNLSFSSSRTFFLDRPRTVGVFTETYVNGATNLC
jgi:hypothetical protein